MTATLDRDTPDLERPAAPMARSAARPTAAVSREGLLAGLAVCGLLGLALWSISGQIDRPFVYDDISFILGARAIAETGWPYGDQGYLLHLYWQREQWALWHPPLYVYLLGLTVALFADAERAARGLSVVCMAAAAGFTFDLARRAVLSRGGSGSRALAAGVLAVALYALNPLAIQATMVLDIDNTVLMVLLLAVVWVAVRWPGSWSTLTVVGLGILYAVALWAKLTTPLALGVALAFTRLFQGTGRRGLLALVNWRAGFQAVAVVVLGWALFGATWIGLSAALGLPIEYTLDVVRHEAVDSGVASAKRLETLRAFTMGVAPALLWIGPFFCLLFVAAGLPRLWSLLSGKRLIAADLLVVLGAAIYLAYVFKLAGNFPKYHAAMLPIWAAASGALVASLAGWPTRGQYIVALAGGGVLLAWYWDRMPALWGIRWEESLNVELIVMPLAIGLGIAALWSLVGRRNLLGALPVALFLLTVTWSLTLDLAQRGLVGSTTYYYGRTGQREAASLLDRLLQPGEAYVASKDVAWYARERHYVDQESWQHVVWEVQQARFDHEYLGIPVRVLALDVSEPSLRVAYDGLLLRLGYQYAAEYGHYIVYVRP